MNDVTRSRRPLFRQAAIGLVLAVAVAGGCRRSPPRTVPEMPALDVPPPPPRNTEPTDAQIPQPVPLVDAPVRTVERPRATPPAPPRDATRPEARPEPAADSARPADEAKPATTLQTTTTNQEGEVDRRIRGLLQTATTDLNRIDYRRLNPDAQLQYDTAKSLIRQSEEALRTRNLAFAQTTAEKAATIASQLAGR